MVYHSGVEVRVDLAGDIARRMLAGIESRLSGK